MGSNKKNTADDLDDLDDFDDEKAISYILTHIDDEYKPRINKKTVGFVLNCEYDFYEAKGFFDDNAPDTVDVDEDEEFDFIYDKVRKEGLEAELPNDVISAILEQEYAYCDQEGIFKD